jgi:ribosomal protein L11 methyltransferase
MADNWLQVRIDVSRDLVPDAEATLEALGAAVTWTEAAGSELVLEPGPGETPLWRAVRLSALLPADSPVEEVRGALAAFPEAGPASVEFSVIADRDWHAEFRRQLRPMRFGTRTWVCPAGEDCPDPAGVRILLEPGMAFGTGTHATTAMCLGWLDGLALAGLVVVDYGCGSGILAIAALRHGAAAAIAVDIDPQALVATRGNADRNGVAAALRVMEPDSLPRDYRCDVLVANILSGTIIRLAPRLRELVRDGTQIALSGILADQADEVRAACADWANLAVTDARDDWVLLTGTARSRSPADEKGN